MTTSTGNASSSNPFLLHLFFFPWSVPYTVFDHPHLTAFAGYPFEHGPGLLREDAAPVAPVTAQPADPQSNTTLDQPVIEQGPDLLPNAANAAPAASLDATPNHAVAFALGVESGYQLEGVVPVTLDTRLLLPSRIELSFRGSFLSEVTGAHRDQAFTSISLASLRFAQTRHVSLQVGVGLRTFLQDTPRRGIDLLLYGMDFYGRHPVLGRVEFHAGTLGHALALQGRATLGFMLGRVELYAGYDHTSVGGAHLGGPIMGLRAWW